MRDREKAAAYASQWVEWERVCAYLRKAWERFPEGFSMPLVTRGGKENEKSTHWWYSPAGTKNAPAE